ncbi:clarin-1 isoform X1 [Sorex araneus]|uniref:clarin-1 isoform X1 n=1 Tax=Sorex araneus TaxID=42254 RepID=UPI0024339B83|nr:clarin-1 isoform X1 [Sorex araneus]
MPSQQKKAIFCTAGVLSFVSALGVVAALGTPLWVRATFLCQTAALLVNASGPELDKFVGELQYGLFHGAGVRQCGLGARPFRFSVFPDLLKAIPMSVHVNVILFSLILVVLTMAGTAVFMYNAFGKPFEALHGPLGLYLLSFVAGKENTLRAPKTKSVSEGSCGGLVMILFASEVKIHHLSESIANYKEGTYAYRTQSETYAAAFWVVLACFSVHVLNGLLIHLAGFQCPLAKSKGAGTPSVAADLMY